MVSSTAHEDIVELTAALQSLETTLVMTSNQTTSPIST